MVVTCLIISPLLTSFYSVFLIPLVFGGNSQIYHLPRILSSGSAPGTNPTNMARLTRSCRLEAGAHLGSDMSMKPS